jgi:NAD(P)-dependent dehydrogenase (short-subunit alcohol dehydrogenase family)
VKLNVASTDDIQAFKQQVGDKPIDLLVNIAGMRVPEIQKLGNIFTYDEGSS